jgi:hypothetical protein
MGQDNHRDVGDWRRLLWHYIQPYKENPGPPGAKCRHCVHYSYHYPYEDPRTPEEKADSKVPGLPYCRRHAGRVGTNMDACSDYEKARDKDPYLDR